MNHTVYIDPMKCIGCGLCASDCVSCNIKVKNKKAYIAGSSCIYCGHCEAVCPQNAITITGFDDFPEEYTEQTRLDPDTLLSAIKTRRSIRIFSDQEVSREMVLQILEAGRFAPTGSNSQSLSYIVLDKKKEEYEKIAVNMFRKITGPVKRISAFIRNMEIDDHFFFKKAPLVILITGSSTFDAGLAAENMAFMAEAQGLGVLYSGFFTMVANYNRKIRRQLDLKPGHKVMMTMVIGYPGIRYHRTVRRKPLDVKYL